MKNNSSSTTDPCDTVQEMSNNSEKEFRKLPIDLRLERWPKFSTLFWCWVLLHISELYNPRSKIKHPENKFICTDTAYWDKQLMELIHSRRILRFFNHNQNLSCFGKNYSQKTITPEVLKVDSQVWYNFWQLKAL